MKIKAVPAPNPSGSVLLVTLVTAGILGVTLASYLTLVTAQSRSVARSQIWNNAMVVAEAGVEDGLQLVNKYVGTPNLGDWSSTSSADGWSPGGGNEYRLTRYMDNAHTTYYEVFITNINNVPTIHSVGYVPGPSWVAGNAPMSRTVEVSTKIDAMFNVAMAALGTIDLKGNGLASDSFDSSDPDYSTDGQYDKLKRKAGGDIVTNNTITNSNFTIGNANIAGHVTTGPNGTYSIGPNGSVGDLPWVDSNTIGIKPGWGANDLNVVFNDVVLPNTSWSATGGSGSPMGGSGTVNGKNYDHVFLIPGVPGVPDNYLVTDNGTIYVGTNVNVRLQITVGNFKPDYIYVAGTGITAGKMTAYLTGTSATLGTEHMTQSGKAANLAFLGLPSVTSLAYKGNGDFTGVMYMPQADFQLAGGGSGTIDFIGSSVTKTIQMNGHYNFHYDESLKKIGPNNGYVVILWKEPL